jgi:hypothetical protein
MGFCTIFSESDAGVGVRVRDFAERTGFSVYDSVTAHGWTVLHARKQLLPDQPPKRRQARIATLHARGDELRPIRYDDLPIRECSTRENNMDKPST